MENWTCNFLKYGGKSCRIFVLNFEKSIDSKSNIVLKLSLVIYQQQKKSFSCKIFIEFWLLN